LTYDFDLAAIGELVLRGAATSRGVRDVCLFRGIEFRRMDQKIMSQQHIHFVVDHFWIGWYSC
jgi:hypothetical protein